MGECDLVVIAHNRFRTASPVPNRRCPFECNRARRDSYPSKPRLQRVEIFLQHQAPVLQDGDPIGDRLDAAQIVRGEEDCDSAIGQLADYFVEERLAGHDIEAQRRIVQNQQIAAPAERTPLRQQITVQPQTAPGPVTAPAPF